MVVDKQWHRLYSSVRKWQIKNKSADAYTTLRPKKQKLLTNDFGASSGDELEAVPRRVRRRVSDPVSERRRPVDDDLDLARVLGGQKREAGQAGVNETGTSK